MLLTAIPTVAVPTISVAAKAPIVVKALAADAPATAPKLLVVPLVITSMEMPAIVAVTINSSSESKNVVKSASAPVAVAVAPAAVKVDKVNIMVSVTFLSCSFLSYFAFNCVGNSLSVFFLTVRPGQEREGQEQAHNPG